MNLTTESDRTRALVRIYGPCRCEEGVCPLCVALRSDDNGITYNATGPWATYRQEDDDH